MISLRLIADALQKSRTARILTVLLLGSGIALAFSALPLFNTLELKTLDLRFRYGAHAEWADTSIVLVTVDQNSLDFIERSWGMKYPWPREYYGLLLEYLEHAGPRLVAFDYDFSQRDVDRLELDGAESDQLFADAMARAANVVLGINLTVQESGDQPGDSVLSKHLRPASTTASRGLLYSRATAPLLSFQASAASVGATNFASDEDGIARRTPSSYTYRGGVIPQFGWACFGVLNDSTEGPIPLPLEEDLSDSEGNRLVYWYGRGGPDGVFRYYSIHSLIVSAAKMRQGLPADVSPELFRDKKIIVGGSAAGLYDFKPTPFTYLEQYPGMEIQATVLSNLLNGHGVRQVPWWIGAVITLLLSLLTVWLFFRSHHIALSTFLVAAAALAYT
ncbi:MAG TPA: CHASE2 domain-containing protein, partial [Bacteroidota bacterium]|nr:CHASE2 domain-containing protein [Bacteroidota bacterium]